MPENLAPENLQTEDLGTNEAIARLAQLLFDIELEIKDQNPTLTPAQFQPETQEISIQKDSANSLDQISNYQIAKYSTEITENLLESLLGSPYAVEASQEDAMQKLQSLLVEPGLEDVVATVSSLSKRLQQVEIVVGDPALSNKLAELESQLTDSSERDALNAQLSQLAKQQSNLPLEINRLRSQLENLEFQILSPESLVTLMLPIIGELLQRKMLLSETEICETLVPIVDQLIRRRTEQDRKAMSEAIATLIPLAISHAIEHFPEQTAQAIAPEIALAIQQQIQLDHEAISNALAPQIGAAIKQQIFLERDVMVDALYPVIGSTIAKYLAEAIRLINQKVENAFSVEGIKRKFRAKLRGVSEAELIWQESMPFVVRAIFLIHKTSGLIIADVQPQAADRLESDMIAGMLTAIRSFASDCLSQPGASTELDQIDYGSATITLEIAGYCYLATVIEGSLPPFYLKQIRQVFSQIVQTYGQTFETYNGDPDSISSTLPLQLQKLLESGVTSATKTPRSSNPILMGISAIALGLGIWWGVSSYKQVQARQLEQRIQQAIVATPSLTIYGLQVSAKADDQITLTGKLPHLYLKQQAEAIALRNTADSVKIENQIQTAIMPPDPVARAAEVARTIRIWNQQPDTRLQVSDRAGKIMINGTIPLARASQITQSFARIPGVVSVTNTITVQPPTITTQIYFEPGSITVKPSDRPKLERIVSLLKSHRQLHLKIIGYADASGDLFENQQLAWARAQSTQKLLVQMGISAQILDHTVGEMPSPLPKQSLWQGRRVKFELFSP